MSAPRTTIRRKLVGASMLTSALAVLLTGAVFITHQIITDRRGLVEAMTTRAQILAANSTGALSLRNVTDARRVFLALSVDPNTTLAALYDERGHLFATYPPTVAADAFPRAPERTGHRFTTTGLHVSLPVVSRQRQLGTVYLVYSLHEFYAHVRTNLFVLLLAVLASIPAAFALSVWLQRRLSEPLLALAGVAQRVSEQKDYSARGTVIEDDEVGYLTEAFNEMLDQNQRLNADLERRVLARTAELEAANKELEAFSYSVSHDLRAPLRHVAGFAELLEKRAGAQLDETCQRYLRTVTDGTRRMGALIDDLLSFSRMGRMELRTTPVDLDQLVSPIVEELRAEGAGRQVEWNVAPLGEVQGDPALLRMVFVNLLSNAFKYTRTRDVAQIAVRAEVQGDETVVSIHDNGVGFDMAYESKLFGVFQRLHAAEDFEGTGIGLANVRRIVHRHGGRTWARGEVERGATFYFSVPTWKEAA